MDFDNLFQPVTLIFLIPVLAVLGGIVQMLIKHRERMAMIERGMNPDQAKIDARRDDTPVRR